MLSIGTSLAPFRLRCTTDRAAVNRNWTPFFACSAGGGRLAPISVSLADGAFLLAAGVVAGGAGSAGGIASLVSYPALLAVGIAPLPANVTNAVAGVTLGLGSTLSSREELRGQRRRLLRLARFSAIGGTVGAVLLLVTPATVFDWVVPFLVAGASGVLLFQPRLSRWHQSRERRGADAAAIAIVFAVAVYSGYFGAGAGIMILAALSVLVERDLVRANAIKNALLTFTDAIPAVIFALAGRVVWAAAIPVAVGLFAGGAAGPVLVRRTPPALLRAAIGTCGLGLATFLLVRAVA